MNQNHFQNTPPSGLSDEEFLTWYNRNQGLVDTVLEPLESPTFVVMSSALFALGVMGVSTLLTLNWLGFL